MTGDIFACPYVLPVASPRPCGYVQRGPGYCPYDHGQQVALIPLPQEIRITGNGPIVIRIERGT